MGAAIEQLNQSHNTLSMTDLASAVERTYARVRQYCDVAEVQRWLGAVRLVGYKGARYPQEAMEKLNRLMAAADAKLITPGTVSAWLEQMAEPGEQLMVASAPALQSNGLAQMQAVVTGIQACVTELRALSVAAPREDELLRAEEVGAILKCSRATVRKHVSPVMRGRWRKSDVMRYIAGL